MYYHTNYKASSLPHLPSYRLFIDPPYHLIIYFYLKEKKFFLARRDGTVSKKVEVECWNGIQLCYRCWWWCSESRRNAMVMEVGFDTCLRAHTFIVKTTSLLVKRCSLQRWAAYLNLHRPTWCRAWFECVIHRCKCEIKWCECKIFVTRNVYNMLLLKEGKCLCAR